MRKFLCEFTCASAPTRHTHTPPANAQKNKINKNEAGGSEAASSSLSSSAAGLQKKKSLNNGLSAAAHTTAGGSKAAGLQKKSKQIPLTEATDMGESACKRRKA
jgi:hypothetical protein